MRFGYSLSPRSPLLRASDRSPGSAQASQSSPATDLAAENLQIALSGPAASWIQAAFRQAESDPLAAALSAAALASALAQRAVAFLEEEMQQREASACVGATS